MNNVAQKLLASGLFTEWRDPVSGARSLVLSTRIAPVQQSFYYTNPSMTDDCRFLWFTCAFPPAPHKMLAVADTEAGRATLFPETALDGHAYINPATGDAYWTTGLELWRRGPDPATKPELLNRFPTELARGRKPGTIATHLSLRADGKTFAIDARFPRETIVGELPLDGSPFVLWQSITERFHDHALFNPVFNDLILLPEDSHSDALTGEHSETKDRLWTIRRGEEARQIFPNTPMPSANRGHEWWGADGKSVWFLDYSEGPNQGTKRVNLGTGDVEIVWPEGRSHSHCDPSERFFAGDIVSWPNDAWRVAFYDTMTQKRTNLVTLLPPCAFRSKYHIHPHPQFTRNGKFVCYTTNVFDSPDLALAAVEDIV